MVCCVFLVLIDGLLCVFLALVLRLHHKERLVEVVRRAGLDPATLYGRAELEAELKRWYVTVAPRAEGEAEQQYLQRLRKVSGRVVALMMS